MKIPIKAILLLLITCVSAQALGTIRIVLSAALTDAYYEFRKQQYIASFCILAGYGYNDFYIIEALKKQGPTFLDDYCQHVFYATANNPNLRNKGINEAKTMLEGSYHFGFDPDDMIVKLTGRYQLVSEYFLKLVENNPEYDAIVKVDASGQVHTLGFAMRCKYLQDMYEHMDYGKIERDFINIEAAVGGYIRQKEQEGTIKVLYVVKLDIVANVFGSSVCSGAPNQSFYF